MTPTANVMTAHDKLPAVPTKKCKKLLDTYEIQSNQNKKKDCTVSWDSYFMVPIMHSACHRPLQKL